MWTIFKALFNLSIFTFGFVNFTGSLASVRPKQMFKLIELTKDGLRWTANGDQDTSKVGEHPCTYNVKMKSKYKDLEPTPLQKGFFDANNLDISVTAECPESYLSEEMLEDLRTLMLNYDDLTYTQKVVVDHRIKTGYYKSTIIEKTKLPYAAMSSSAWEYGRIANIALLLNRLLSLLFKRFIIGNRQATVEN